MGIFKRGLIVATVAQFLLITQFVTVAQAEMLGTDAAIAKYSQHADRTFLLNELQREDVQQAIIDQGIDPVEAERRLAALSDAEVASMVGQIEDGSAGADIVGTLFTVFVILLVTDILCLTRIFSFTRCAR